MAKSKSVAVLFTAADVKAAAAKWTASPGYGGFRTGRQYEVEIDGKRYPPKAIAALAFENAGNGIVSPADFKGARYGKWIRQLDRLNFKPQLKNTAKSTLGQAPVGKVGKNGGNVALSAQVSALSLDIAKIVENAKQTEIVTQILARLGQGQFRSSLLKQWNNQCAVTGVSCAGVLRAAHIKRWADCKGKQAWLRLSSENGLLLSANVDCLFEIGLIGFTSTGRLVKSPKLDKVQAEACGVLPGMKLGKKASPLQSELLLGHRTLHQLSNRGY